MGVVLSSPGDTLAGFDDTVIIASAAVPLKMLGSLGQSNVHSAPSRVPTGIIMSQAITIAPSYAPAFSNAKEIRQAGANPADPPLWVATGGGVQGPVDVAPRGVNGDEPAGGVFGSYLAAAHYMDRARPNGIRIAYMGLGGTSLATNWKAPGGGYPTAPPRLADLAGQFILTALTSYGLTLADYLGTYWSHGTTEALNTTNANNHTTNFAAFFNYMVTTYFGGYIGGNPANGPVKPWFIELPNTNSGGGADLTTVRNSKIAFVAATPNTFAVSAEGLPFFGAVGNETHYPADGNVIVGERVGEVTLFANSIPDPPRARFKWFGTALSIVFTDTSTVTALGSVTITSRAWAFGDGGTSTSTNPTHVYPSPGSYSVTLTVTASNGATDSITWVVIAVASVAWPIDATALIALPVNGTQSIAFHAAALPSSATSGPPTHIWDMQTDCQSSPFQQPDGVGSVPLSAQNAFTSRFTSGLWTAKGNLFADNVANRNLSSSAAALPDASATSTMLLWEGVTPAAIPSGGSARGFMNCGVTGNTDLRISLTTGKLRQVGTVNTEVVNNICDGGRHFVIVQDNRTTGLSYVFTDQEWFVLPSRTPASGKFAGIGSGAANSSASSCHSLALYEGAAAEKTPLEIWRLMTAKGWNLAWSQPR